jgi:hypothetical protein
MRLGSNRDRPLHLHFPALERLRRAFPRVIDAGDPSARTDADGVRTGRRARGRPG